MIDPSIPSASPEICSQCHQPIRPEYYFCPNCGKKLHEEPLSTTLGTQAWIYFLSIILPSVCYLAIGSWPAMKYLKSPDPKTRRIGIIAIIVLLASTGLTFWFAITWTEQAFQSALSGVGNLGGGLP